MQFATCSNPTISAPYFLSDAGDGGDAGPQCSYYVDLSCPPFVPKDKGCILSTAQCLQLCTLDAGLFDCDYTESTCLGAYYTEAGPPAVTVGCGICPNAGRRPPGLVRPASVRAAGPLGAYFASMAHLEAASAIAFERLVHELRAHRAPREIMSVARRSMRDEVRHARCTARLARAHGGKPERPRVRARSNRGLESIARDNAIEGCVRETFGALVACWQASAARDPEVRRCMASIAVDETRHAALAWAIAEWAAPRLDSAARARVAAARRRAVEQLEVEAMRDPPGELVAAAGLPGARESRRLLDGLRRELWAEQA